MNTDETQMGGGAAETGFGGGAWIARPPVSRSFHPAFWANYLLKTDLLELPGLSVTLDRLVYAPELPAPPDKPHSFVYFISIHNGSDRTVTIKGRKWVVTNTRGEVTAIEGDGVVGECPVLRPGEKFSYNSRHILDTRRAIAEGSYLGVDANGQRVVVRIPTFEMVVPEGGGAKEAWA